MVPQGPAAAQLSPDIEYLTRSTAWHAVPVITGLSERSTKHRAQHLHDGKAQQRQPTVLTAHSGCLAPVNTAPGSAGCGGVHDMVQLICCTGTWLVCCFCLPTHHQSQPTS